MLIRQAFDKQGDGDTVARLIPNGVMVTACDDSREGDQRAVENRQSLSHLYSSPIAAVI